MSLLSLRREVAVPVGIETGTFDPNQPYVAVKKASGGYVYFNIKFQQLGLIDRITTSREVKNRRKVSLEVMTDPALVEALKPYGNPISLHNTNPDLLERMEAGNVIPWKRLHLQEYRQGERVFYAPTTVH